MDNQQPVTETSEVPLTPEQIKDRKLQMTAYWKEQKSFLTAQRDHQKLLTEIDELITRSVIAQMQMANILAKSKEPEQPLKERALKKEPV